MSHFLGWCSGDAHNFVLPPQKKLQCITYYNKMHNKCFLGIQHEIHQLQAQLQRQFQSATTFAFTISVRYNQQKCIFLLQSYVPSAYSKRQGLYLLELKSQHLASIFLDVSLKGQD